MWISLMLVAALGASRGGVSMPDNVKVANKKLVLNGMGIREATVFNVDVYVAGLYLEKKSDDAQAIIKEDTARRIHMEFVRDVDREDLIKAWRTGFSSHSDLRPRVDTLVKAMSDMEEGDAMTFTYVPGKGTEVKVKGKVKSTIAGADFASALVKIWLGAKPPNAGLKKGMMGRG